MIHFDGIIFSLQPHGGISVYFRELLKRIRHARVDAHLALETPLKSDVTDLVNGAAGEDSFTCSRQAARPVERYRSARMGQAPHQAAVFHSTYYRRADDHRLPAVVTVHDFAYERCLSGPRRWVHSWQKFAAIRQAQAIICISEATRDDLLELVGLRPGQTLHVVYNGVGDQFQPLHQDGAPDRRPFALFVGSRGRYKNFDLAVAALQHCPGVELVCVGGGALTADDLAGMPADVAGRVRHLGLVSDAQLNKLYNEAACLVYPSAYEGFGIPVLEAMRAGCPVVCIDCKAVLEVGGDALLVAKPDAEDVARQIRAALETPGQVARVRGLRNSARFSWDRHFRETVAVYRQLSGAIPPIPALSAEG